jgi:hypothetical protein
MRWLMIIIGTILSGCGGPTMNYKFNNDFESIDGWFENEQIVKGDAHSGIYLCITTPGSQFSLTFRRKIADFNGGNVSHILVSAWVKFSKKGSKANFIVSMDEPGSLKPIIYNASKLENKILKAEKWEHVVNKIDIPAGKNVNNIISVYVMNTGNSSVYVDDISYDFN